MHTHFWSKKRGKDDTQKLIPVYRGFFPFESGRGKVYLSTGVQIRYGLFFVPPFSLSIIFSPPWMLFSPSSSPLFLSQKKAIFKKRSNLFSSTHLFFPSPTLLSAYEKKSRSGKKKREPLEETLSFFSRRGKI